MHPFVRYLSYFILSALLLNYYNIEGMNLLLYTLVLSIIISTSDNIMTNIVLSPCADIKDVVDYQSLEQPQSQEQDHGTDTMVPDESVINQMYFNIENPIVPLEESNEEIMPYAEGPGYQVVNNNINQNDGFEYDQAKIMIDQSKLHDLYHQQNFVSEY